MLYLPLDNEDMSWFAWRTSLLQINHTRALMPIPREFGILFSANDVSGMLPSPTGCYSYIVACKTFGGASATMRIRYSTISLDVVELEWIGGSPSENNMLDRAKTMACFPWQDVQGDFIESWPGVFSNWMEDMLCEFVMESAKSCRRHSCMNKVWEEAKRAARTNLAMSIPDQDVALQFLRLPGNEAVLLGEQLVDDVEMEA